MVFIPVQAVLIIQAESHIDGDQNGVQHIEPDGGVQVVDDLVNASGKITDDDQAHEKITLPGRVLHADGFDDGKRPAASEADDHDDFPDADDVLSLFHDYFPSMLGFVK